MNLQRQGESLAPEAFAADGMRTTTALTNHRRSNAASADVMPARRTVPKTIFIVQGAPAEPRFPRKPRVAADVGATKTAKLGISRTKAPVAWHGSVLVKPGMSGDPISVNGALTVKSNVGAADQRAAKNAPPDHPYALKRKTPPSAPLGVGEIPHQPPHPKPKAHSPIQGEREVEKPQAAR